MKQQRKHFGPLSRLLFLDVLFNRRTGPILIYAAVIVAIGVLLYHWLEGWSWVDALYFVIITLTTIGYGDLTPTTPLTKIVTIFYGINGIILLLTMFDLVRKVRGWEIEPAHHEVEQKNENK